MFCKHLNTDFKQDNRQLKYYILTQQIVIFLYSQSFSNKNTVKLVGDFRKYTTIRHKPLSLVIMTLCPALSVSDTTLVILICV